MLFRYLKLLCSVRQLMTNTASVKFSRQHFALGEKTRKAIEVRFLVGK